MAKLSPLPALRIGLASCALVAAGFAGWQALSAQGLGSFNSNAPVDFDAAKIELQDKANRVVLTGDVVIKQGDLTLRAERTTVAYTNTGSLQIQRLDAVGNVLVTRGTEAARGSAAVYDFNKRVIVMSGAVNLKRGSDNLNGGRLVIDLNTGLSSVDGRGGVTSDGKSGRVTGTFSVPKNGTAGTSN